MITTGTLQAGAVRPRSRRLATPLALVVAAVLAAGCTKSGTTTGAPSSSPAPPTTSPTLSPTPSATVSASPSPTGGGLEVVPSVAARLAPSAVTILTSDGTGSGVVYTRDGLIVTNEHVVRGNTTVQVAYADGQRGPGRVQAVDAVTDLALVQANRRDLPPVRFQPRLPVVGSLTVVIGSPLGFQNTVTAGIVSGLHREIPGSASQGQSLVDLLQTDAPISPGNSGGMVANAAGEVIGISEAYIPPSQGAVALGFAIPAATVTNIIGQLQRSGRARHAFVGIIPAPITPDIAAQLGLSGTDGVIVADVVPGGPADRAGLRPGDVITAVDSKATATPEDWLAILRQHQPGDTLTFTVHTDGSSPRPVRVTVSDVPS